MNINNKEAEKILKYQDLKIEIERMWRVRGTVVPIVVRALGVDSNAFTSYCALISEDLNVYNIQKSSLLGMSHIIRKVLQLGEGSYCGPNNNTQTSLRLCKEAYIMIIIKLLLLLSLSLLLDLPPSQ